jgi:hypothetical protein
MDRIFNNCRSNFLQFCQLTLKSPLYEGIFSVLRCTDKDEKDGSKQSCRLFDPSGS